MDLFPDQMTLVVIWQLCEMTNCSTCDRDSGRVYGPWELLCESMLTYMHTWYIYACIHGIFQYNCAKDSGKVLWSVYVCTMVPKVHMQMVPHVYMSQCTTTCAMVAVLNPTLCCCASPHVMIGSLMCECIHTYMHVHILPPVCIHAHTHTHIHTYIHTYIHTHAHWYFQRIMAHTFASASNTAPLHIHTTYLSNTFHVFSRGSPKSIRAKNYKTSIYHGKGQNTGCNLNFWPFFIFFFSQWWTSSSACMPSYHCEYMYMCMNGHVHVYEWTYTCVWMVFLKWYWLHIFLSCVGMGSTLPGDPTLLRSRERQINMGGLCGQWWAATSVMCVGVPV